ncbi:MFS transporter [Streptomyces noursei]|uniref:MFS transporter n=1 Tax=Streptomyces noursei TaxID=1971 RepID=UPI00069E8C85|nr:MFS transporter [Streptomyces noursei]
MPEDRLRPAAPGRPAPPEQDPARPAPPGAHASFDDLPLNRFHLKITALTFGANFSDGYQLGIIGIALTAMAPQMHLGALWQGLMGASALIGVFVGSIVIGWAADRMGRQRLYMLDFLLIAVASVLQFFVTGPVELFVLRLLIGFGIGADYALGPTLVAEFVPRRYRGGLLASLTVLWTIGYITAFFFGTYLVGLGGDSWRWLLASSALPAVAVLLLRIGTPESPRWLIGKGRIDEARRVVTAYVGSQVDFDAFAAQQRTELKPAPYRALFGRKHWRNTAFGVLFYNCQVIPYFAIYTFLPLVLVKISLAGQGFLSEALLNLFLLLGGAAGLWLVAGLTRRRLTIGSFAVLAASLAPMGIWPDAPAAVLFPLFLVFTFTMSAATNLDQVYPPELFPTELRSSGVGLLNGMSRVGSAIGTFLLPVSLSGIGFAPTMMALTVVLLIGALVSALWAPETSGAALE